MTAGARKITKILCFFFSKKERRSFVRGSDQQPVRAPMIDRDLVRRLFAIDDGADGAAEKLEALRATCREEQLLEQMEAELLEHFPDNR